MTGDLDTVRGLLARLRRSVRRTWIVRGLAYAAAAVLAAVLLSFALDVVLDLPLPVRAVHLVIMAVVVTLVARAVLFRPLRVEVTDADLAQALEHGVPALGDRLVSALDFERRIRDTDEPESRELMREVIRDAQAASTGVDASRLVDTRKARRALAVAAGAALAVVVTAAAMPEEFSLWIRRGLLLGDVAWPRRTTIRVLDFPEIGPRIVTRGDDLRIVAVADGDRPRELVLHYEELSDAPVPEDGAPEVTFTDERRMYPVEGEAGSGTGEGTYAFDLRAVSASFRFFVTGGDDQDERPLYEVRALVAPRIASIAGRVVRPAYSGLPDETVREAQFDVLEGSRVEFELDANMPLRSARLAPPDGPARDLELTGSRDRISLSFEVTQPVEFHLELTGTDGQTNRPDDDVFRIRAVEDRPPTVRVLFPPSRLYRTPNGIVPVKLVIEDDFHVAAVTVEVRTPGALLASIPVRPKSGADAAPGAVAGEQPVAVEKRVDAYAPVDLKNFQGDAGTPVKAGDVVHLVVRATDSHGNQAESGDLTIEILSPEDFERRLAQRQTALREELTVVRRTQQKSRAAITELRRVVGGVAARPVDVDKARALQVDQARVTNDLSQFLNGIRRVFDSYVLDRVGADTTIERLVPLYHEALAQPAANEDEVFPESLYAKIVAEKRADRLYDPEVLGALLDIMDLGDVAARELSPAVGASLDAFCGDGHAASHLEEAERRAAELDAKLAELDLRMQRWEDLSALIEIAQAIRDTEESLSNPSGAGRSPPK